MEGKTELQSGRSSGMLATVELYPYSRLASCTLTSRIKCVVEFAIEEFDLSGLLERLRPFNIKRRGSVDERSLNEMSISSPSRQFYRNNDNLYRILTPYGAFICKGRDQNLARIALNSSFSRAARGYQCSFGPLDWGTYYDQAYMFIEREAIIDAMWNQMNTGVSAKTVKSILENKGSAANKSSQKTPVKKSSTLNSIGVKGHCDILRQGGVPVERFVFKLDVNQSYSSMVEQADLEFSLRSFFG
ncbi:neutral invertase [Striga asiatica]|uniref:Neutral invertase n=1 Tax=Striga asiatica TaxID=4170 RepID=A0A5A7R4K4_STRAF|nr:neutral invertase [Striga asiatica]